MKGVKYVISIVLCLCLLLSTSVIATSLEEEIKATVMAYYKACENEDIEEYMSLFDFSNKEQYPYDYVGLTEATALEIFRQYDMKIDSISYFVIDVDEANEFALAQYRVVGSLTGETTEGETKTIQINKLYVAGLHNVGKWKIIFAMSAEVYYASLYDTSHIIAREPVEECSVENPSGCLFKEECEACGLYWYDGDGTCHITEKDGTKEDGILKLILDILKSIVEFIEGILGIGEGISEEYREEIVPEKEVVPEIERGVILKFQERFEIEGCQWNPYGFYWGESQLVHVVDMGTKELGTFSCLGEEMEKKIYQAEAEPPVKGHSYCTALCEDLIQFKVTDVSPGDWVKIDYLVEKESEEASKEPSGEEKTSKEPSVSKEEATKAYQEYIAAYNNLTDLMEQGKGHTPEAEQAYEEYKAAKEKYEQLAREAAGK